MSQDNNWQHLVQSKLSRRNFLRGVSLMGTGAVAQWLAACAPPPTATEAPAAEPTEAEVAEASPEPTAEPTAVPTQEEVAEAEPEPVEPVEEGPGLPFEPIEPTIADDLILPAGFSYTVVVKRGDTITPDEKTFGDNADWTGWYPIDGLEEGDSAEEGLMVVNNEYLNDTFVSRYSGDGSKTPEQIEQEKQAVGFNILHIRRENGAWQLVADSEMNRKYDAIGPIIPLTGPVAGAPVVGGVTEVVGSLANCSGGQTPWLTALSCEENYQLFYGEDSIVQVDVGTNYRWADDPDTVQMPEHYGWVVEVDPYSGEAKKRTAMGRFHHENVAITIGDSGRVVGYMGDDARDEVVYKFVSDRAYDPNNREANLDILESGTLYAADFGSGSWIPVVWEGNEDVLGDPDSVEGYPISSQADVLTYANVAARALGATKTDRPEDIEIHPETGDVYIAFTNNSRHGNYHGQIVRIMEEGGNPESLSFMWDIFAVGGPQSGFSSPDNMVFDDKGNLWVVTDISTGSLNSGIYEFHGNNSLFMFATSGEMMGQALRFASAPVEAELTGPTWVGGDTLFLSVQHPGENSPSVDEPTSTWPEGDEPRAAVIAITGPFT